MLPFIECGYPLRQIDVPLRAFYDPRMSEQITRIRPLRGISNETKFIIQCQFIHFPLGGSESGHTIVL